MNQLFVVLSLVDLKTEDSDLIWADGQIGALPVFVTKEAANEYALPSEQVIEVTSQQSA